MKKHTTRPDSATAAAETAPHLFDNWFDPIEFGVRSRVRDFIETMMEEELEAVLSRPRYGRVAPTASKEAGSAEAAATGHRHGHRSRTLLGTFGPVEVAMPRARLNAPDGGTTEWKSTALKAYQRRTIAADAVIAATYLAGTNTRRVRRALMALFGGAVSKDTVSRTWRKVKTDWDAWNARSLADEPIVRLILDGTVVRVRLDRKATTISLLVVLGVRADGQKVLLAIKSMGGESAEAWRSVLDDGLELSDVHLRRKQDASDRHCHCRFARHHLRPFWCDRHHRGRPAKGSAGRCDIGFDRRHADDEGHKGPVSRTVRCNLTRSPGFRTTQKFRSLKSMVAPLPCAPFGCSNSKRSVLSPGNSCFGKAHATYAGSTGIGCARS